jgi:putative restriction endonuclease
VASLGVRRRADGHAARVVARLASLRQYQRGSVRSPHKPLLVLLALGRLAASGSSELPWSVPRPCWRS